MKAFKIGITSEIVRPLGLSPFETLDWAIMNEADGVQFDPDPVPGPDPDRSFLKELAEYAEENHLFLEWGGARHRPPARAEAGPEEFLAANRKAAEAARALGLSTILSLSDRPARRAPGARPSAELVRGTASNLKGLKSMLKDLGVVLAVAPGHDLSTFDLARVFEMTETGPGECFGVCFDTLAPLALMEDPVAASERILPWIVATRITDGGILLSGEGFTSFPAEAGTGVIDFRAIFVKLSTLERKINLCLADHAGDVVVPVFDPAVASGFPDLGSAELLSVLRLAIKSQERLDEGKITILEASRWAERGERGLRRGLKALRRVVEEGIR